jgi:hypothetical protein
MDDINDGLSWLQSHYPVPVAGDRIAKVIRSRLAELEKDRENLRGLIEHALLDVWQGSDIDGGGFQDEAERRGLIVEVPASEEIRAEFETDVMFTWAWSPLARESEGSEG